MSIPELAEANTVSAPRDLHILRLADSTPDIPSTVRDALEASGWQITEQKNGFHGENVPANPDAILALDELWHPLLTRATPDQWNAVQALAGSDKQLLWATQGLHLGRVTNPEQALAHGLFRVARMEDPSVRRTTLDVGEADAVTTGRV
jgi:hypothetical protein